MLTGGDETIGLAAQKAKLRGVMLAKRDAIPPEDRARRSSALAGRLEDPDLRRHLPESGGVIAGFFAIRSEIDPAALMMRLADAGFALALPRVGAEGLVFHLWAPGDPLVKGRFGLNEPGSAAPILAPALYLAPLLAFDRAGGRLGCGRLGYGKGYYDRVFARDPGIPRIGIAFAEQEVTEVPIGPHDMRLQAVIAV